MKSAKPTPDSISLRAELMGLIDALDTSAAADGRIDCHPSIRTEYAYKKSESFARSLTDRLAQAEQESTALNLTMDRQTKRIAELEAQLEAVGAGGVGAMVPNEVESRELILQHAVMDSVQLMNGCVMTSPTLQKAHELLRQSLWDYSEAVSGTRKATDHSTLLVRALRSLEDTEKCHGSTTRRTVLMADIRSATIASAQPAPAVARPDGYCIPKSEQFTFSKSRPFSKAWQPFYLAPSLKPLTDQVICDLIPINSNMSKNDQFRWMARAVERAHGITAQQGGGA